MVSNTGASVTPTFSVGFVTYGGTDPTENAKGTTDRVVRFPLGNAGRERHDGGVTTVVDDSVLERAVRSRDPRFDGWFVVAVTSTGIYCRPSCPATPARADRLRFYPTAAAAQLGGFRACKRCRPDATPGSPQWRVRSDVVARAMRLIADGVVERDGVAGLAGRLGYSERHLTRIMTAELGAGPLAIARAERAHTARLLIESTALAFTDIAFAAGFGSVRQFNDTVRAVFAVTPTALRDAGQARARGGRHDQRAAPDHGANGQPAAIQLRLAMRHPFDAAGLFAFIGRRAVPGVEAWDGTAYSRTLDLPHGHGVVTLTPAPAGNMRVVYARLAVAQMRDLAAAVDRCRRLLDLDADPEAIDADLGAHPLLAPLVAARPGLRSPGSVDGAELAVRAVLGQQVSVAGARTLAARLTRAAGEPLDQTQAAFDPSLTHVFPTARALAELDPASLPMPRARSCTLQRLATAIAQGALVLDPGVDREALRAALLAMPGIGPWTASYVLMRAVGDPDQFLPTDLGVRRSLDRLGADSSPAGAARLAESWRPWRSYALHHLWAGLEQEPTPRRTPD